MNLVLGQKYVRKCPLCIKKDGGREVDWSGGLMVTEGSSERSM